MCYIILFFYIIFIWKINQDDFFISNHKPCPVSNTACPAKPRVIKTTGNVVVTTTLNDPAGVSGNCDGFSRGKQETLQPSRGPTHRVAHAVVVGLLLGEEAAGPVRGVGQLGPVDEVVHGGAAAAAVTSSSATSSCSCSWSSSSTASHSSSRGVCVREVEVALAVVVVAWKEDEGTETRQGGLGEVSLLTEQTRLAVGRGKLSKTDVVIFERSALRR